MTPEDFIKKTVSDNPVVLFMKGTAQFPQCGFSGRAIALLKQSGVKNLITVNVLVNGQFVGGSDIMTEMFESGELQTLLKDAKVV